MLTRWLILVGFLSLGCQQKSSDRRADPSLTSSDRLSLSTVGGIEIALEGRGLLAVEEIEFRSTQDGEVFRQEPEQSTSTLIRVLTPHIPCDDEGTYRLHLVAGESVIETPVEVEFFAQPTVSSFSPRASLLEGGETMRLQGDCFGSTAEVRFGDLLAESVVRVSEAVLDVVVPSSDVSRDVSIIVSNQNGRSSQPSGPFSYTTLPRLTVSSPAGILGGDVPLAVKVFDDEGDRVDVRVELLENGVARDATLVRGSDLRQVSSGSTGSFYQVWWGSEFDIPSEGSGPVSLRLTPQQSGGEFEGVAVSTRLFDVDNRRRLNWNSPNAEPGSEVTLILRLDSLDPLPLIGLDLSLSFDAEFLSIQSVIPGMATMDAQKTLRFFEPSVGRVRISLLGESSDLDANAQTIEDGVLAEVVLGVSTEAIDGAYELTVDRSVGVTQGASSFSVRGATAEIIVE